MEAVMGRAMRISIEEETKARIARIGPVRTFGNYDIRNKLNDTELAKLFDEKWELGLQQAVENSLPCEFDVAQSRLQGKQKEWVDPDQEQRQFRFQSMDFIVQFDQQSGDGRELTQLWKVQSGDDHPKTLWVTFDTVAERKRFRAIADHLRKHDEAFGLEIVRDFMAKFDAVMPPSEDDE
jgi:hypothetical protein